MELLQVYARRHFPALKYLDFALRVERYTLTKAANLVLNVDGCIGALFLDLLSSSSLFTQVCGSFDLWMKPQGTVVLVCLEGIVRMAGNALFNEADI